jgi:probable rRNA maturation factor
MDSATSEDQDIVVRILRDYSDIEFSSRRLKKLVKVTCGRFNVTDATVSVAIVDDSQIRRLNRRFLNKNQVTDCLSFDLSDEQRASDSSRNAHDTNADSKARYFELVVNGERAIREAGRRGHSAEAELALYTVHSLLHNLGFDDGTERRANKMHETEDQILQDQGYGFVYDAEGQRK